jgi:hypothetical protein
MAATILNSPRAVEMSLFVVRAFVRLRTVAREHAELAEKVSSIERRLLGHDEDLAEVFAVLRALVSQPEKPRKAIGFGRAPDAGRG